MAFRLALSPEFSAPTLDPPRCATKPLERPFDERGPRGRPSFMGLMVLLASWNMACASSHRFHSDQGMPSWVRTGESKEYPRSEYLVGLGRGPSMKAAENNARAEIAKVFEVRVEQRTSEVSRYSEWETKGEKGGFARNIDIRQATQSETSKVLRGVEIVARWEGPQGECAALAVLSRHDASERLHDRGQGLLRSLKGLLATGKKASDPLEAARAYYQAARKLIALDAVNRDIAILGVMEPVRPPISADEAFKSFQEVVRKGVPFGIAIEGQEASRVADAIASELTKRGIPIASASVPPRVLIEGKLSFEKSGREVRDFVFVRFQVVLQAKDMSSQDVVASVGPISEDASGRNYTQAYERALWLITERHVPDFLDRLFERLFGADYVDNSE